MKNGFFTLRFLPKKAISLSFLFLLSLQGCSSFLMLSDRDDPNEYDRGFTRDATEEEDDSAVADTSSRQPASEESDELGYEQRRVKRAIESRDVVLGMTRQQVAESWGTPSEREVAGRGLDGHERWTYGSRFSLKGPRTVIFENGRVAGWSQ